MVSGRTHIDIHVGARPADRISTHMELQTNISLREHTTMKIGGEASVFTEVFSVSELVEVLEYAKANGLPVYILSGGSNTFFSDDGFKGLVVKISLKGIDWGENGEVSVSAGEGWDQFVSWCVEKGYFGIENLSGIPGSVGAAPIQNIGAYGVEVREHISSVEVFDTEVGEMKIFQNEECQFGYRDSFFKKTPGRYVVVKVHFKLLKEFVPRIEYKDLKKYFSDSTQISAESVRNAVLEIREGKFPDLSKVGTSGSFFKNSIVTKEKFEELKQKFENIPSYKVDEDHVKIPTAWLLDVAVGRKGFCEGCVEFFEKQPLIVVNRGGATSRELIHVTNMVAKEVYEKTGIELEREVQFVG